MIPAAEHIFNTNDKANIFSSILSVKEYETLLDYREPFEGLFMLSSVDRLVFYILLINEVISQ